MRVNVFVTGCYDITPETLRDYESDSYQGAIAEDCDLFNRDPGFLFDLLSDVEIRVEPEVEREAA